MKNKGLPFGLKFLLPIFLIAHNLVFAQEQGKALEYDLGQVLSSQLIQKKYEIKERIKSAVSLCECVKVKVILFDEGSILEIEFNPAGYNGSTVEEIKLLDEKDNLITLKIKAYVK
ncbi:MAG: hypothetical protein WC412_03305 [Candidatus Omnitrophota bacterium]|jgi:hypothetical protein